MAKSCARWARSKGEWYARHRNTRMLITKRKTMEEFGYFWEVRSASSSKDVERGRVSSLQVAKRRACAAAKRLGDW
jgi:hypothetical protein